MDLVIEGGAPLRGEVRVPADKSILHRALMLSGLAPGTSKITAHAAGADNRATMAAMAALGVRAEATACGFEVYSDGVAQLRAPGESIDCGNSGTSLRLLCGILVGAGLEGSLVGDRSLLRRPMGRVCRPLRHLGGAIAGELGDDGKERPPIRVQPGAFAGGLWRTEVASAQVKSALLVAGVCRGVAVQVVEPYRSRDHSELMLRAMGATVTSDDGAQGHRAEVAAGAVLAARDIAVPGDISSAAFLLAAGALVPGSRITIADVGMNRTRTGVLEILEELGAAVRVSDHRYVDGEALGSLEIIHGELRGGRPGLPTVVESDVIPRLIDELVVLPAVASQAPGRLVIRDAGELRVKESDRLSATTELLAAFGVNAEENPDGMSIEGPQRLRAANVEVGGDHRIALTATVLALAAPGTSTLRGFEIADVSFPGFVAVLEALGGRVRVVA